MSDRSLQQRTPDELDAAEGLILLSRFPREFGPRPAALVKEEKHETPPAASQENENAPPAQPVPQVQPVPQAQPVSQAQSVPPAPPAPQATRPIPPTHVVAQSIAHTVQRAVERTEPPIVRVERTPFSPEQALQAYLIRQQYIAGIPPEMMTPMRRLRTSGQPRIPGLVQITNNGVFFPHIPPAQFNGVLHPLPVLPPEIVAARQSAIAAAGRGGRAPGGRHGVPARPYVQPHAPRNTNPSGSRPGNNQTAATPANAQRQAPGIPPQAARGRRRSERAPARGQLRARAETRAVRNETFNIFDALTRHPEICLEVIGYFSPSGLLQMYSISQDFHTFVNGHFIDAIMNVASRCAPEATLLYPGRCYPKLCITPPRTGKVPPPHDRFAFPPSKVPSFRWLYMITYREQITEAILTNLGRSGYELPDRCGLVIKKLWFLMDIPENIRRVWTVQNKNIWPEVDLFLAVLFFTKLERFLESIYGDKCNVLRRLLLARPSITLLHDVVCKRALPNDFKIFQEYLRWKYIPLPHETGVDIVGVRHEQINRFQYEWYGKKGRQSLLKAPDELILRECVARNLDMKQLHVGFFFADSRVLFGLSASQGSGNEPSWVEEIEKNGRGRDMNRLDVVVID